jgi:hypothetical protein
MFGSYKTALALLGMEMKTKKTKIIGKQFLLECLKDFHKENAREASVSDFGNKRLPSEELYIKEFGGLKEALKLI